MNIFDVLEDIRIGSFSLATLLTAIVVLILCLITRHILKRFIDRVIGRTSLDKGIKSFVTAALNMVIWVVIVIIMMDMLGISITSMVAVISIIGVALSLSLQSLLENLFSGLTLLGTRPFSVGDYVDVDNMSGTVERIGLFYTVITTADGKSVFIPNGTITTDNVVNYSANPLRRIDIDISASYDDPPEKVRTAILKAVEMTEGVLSDPEPIIGLEEYGSSSIKYSVFVWVPTPRYKELRFKFNENMYYSFAECGVTMTYDHMNVHILENK